MTRKTEQCFQNLAKVSRSNNSDIYYFEVISLSFKKRTKIGAIYQYFVGNVRFYSQIFDW